MLRSSPTMLYTPQNCALHTLEHTISQERMQLSNKILDKIQYSLESGTSCNIIIVGPRGSGKTHLLAYLENSLEATRPRAGAKTRVISSYDGKRGLSNLRDFLVSCLRSMGVGAEDIQLELENGPKSRSLEIIESLFDRIVSDTSLLVIIDNIESLLSGMNSTAQIRFFEFFANRANISMLGSYLSAHPLDGRKTEQSTLEHCEAHFLEPLSSSGAQRFLIGLARANKSSETAFRLEHDTAEAYVNSVYGLAGGNHRFLAMLSTVLEPSEANYENDAFEHLVDRQLTPFFQRDLDMLSPKEHRIMQAISEQEGRALTVKDAANYTLMSSQSISRLLFDLLNKGLVVKTKVGRESYYEISQPLFRLALEAKSGKMGATNRTVSFLRQWFEIKQLYRQLSDAGKLPRCYHSTRETIRSVQKTSPPSKRALSLLFTEPDRGMPSGDAGHILRQAMFTCREAQFSAALPRLEQVAGLAPDNATSAFYRALALDTACHSGEAIRAYEEFVDRFGHAEDLQTQVYGARSLLNIGRNLGNMGQIDNEMRVYDVVVKWYAASDYADLLDYVAKARINKAYILLLTGGYNDALHELDAALQLVPKDVFARAGRILALFETRQHDDATNAISEVFEMSGFSMQNKMLLISYLIWRFINDDNLLQVLVSGCHKYPYELVGGLVGWLQDAITANPDPQRLGRLVGRLRNACAKVKEADLAFSVMDAYRKHLAGSRTALLDLPLELRRLLVD